MKTILKAIEKNFRFDTLKNGKPRTLAPAPFVMETLREHKKRQEQQKKAAGDLWDDLGFPDLVFTYPNGKHYVGMLEKKRIMPSTSSTWRRSTLFFMSNTLKLLLLGATLIFYFFTVCYFQIADFGVILIQLF